MTDNSEETIDGEAWRTWKLKKELNRNSMLGITFPTSNGKAMTSTIGKIRN